jgi:hypothetical protein
MAHEHSKKVSLTKAGFVCLLALALYGVAATTYQLITPPKQICLNDITYIRFKIEQNANQLILRWHTDAYAGDSYFQQIEKPEVYALDTLPTELAVLNSIAKKSTNKEFPVSTIALSVAGSEVTGMECLQKVDSAWPFKEKSVFKIVDFRQSIKLEPISVKQLDNQTIAFDAGYKYYFITDDYILGNWITTSPQSIRAGVRVFFVVAQ